MNWKTVTVLPIVSALLLSACGVDNNEANETALRNERGATDLQRVQYFPGDDTGSFIPNQNYNYNYNTRYYDDGLRGEGETRQGNQANGEIGNRNMNNAGIDDNLNRTNTNNNRTNQNNESRISVADRAADKIAAMREVDQANVFVSENNAYVAAQLENNTDKRQTKEIEKRISDIVKATDRDIDQVYVSVNPDFYNRTSSYANDIRNGRPIAGFAEEFNTLIKRVFPTNR